MKTVKKNGFILIIVILFMSLISLALLILSSTSRTMAFETRTLSLEAYNRNLLSSGLAWAKHNAQNLARRASDTTIQLDVSRFKIPTASCALAVNNARDHQLEVEIKARSMQGRRQLKQNIKAVVQHAVHDPNWL